MIYFKQYGAQRSGTNYLKRLIELNFKDVTVFGSILGWKHGMYETGNDTRFKCSSHEEWITKKTKDSKVYSVDNHVLKQTSEQLLEACKDLKYLISVKDPYSYIVSFKKFRAKKRPWNEKTTRQWLNRYLESYNQWAKLYSECPERCYVVRYDTLLSNKDVILQSIQTKFDLTPKHDEFLNEEKTVNASTDHGLLISKSKFDPSYYLERQYLNDMPDNIIQVVTDIVQTSPDLVRC